MMTGKNKSKRSLVPLRLQIPLAVLLGIVFVFLLNARFRGGRVGQSVSVPAVGDKAAAADVTAVEPDQRIGLLIDKISAEGLTGTLEDETLPDLAGDPFLKPDRSAAKGRLHGPDSRGHAQEGDDDGRSREELIKSLTLTATLIDSGTNLALINGMLRGENDMIGPFNVVKIQERAAFLRDDSGTVLLKMKGDDTL